MAEKEYIETSDKLTAKLREKSRILEEVSDPQETGKGFGGLARNILKGERAFEALTTGSGLARAAPMLEAVGTSLGMASGIGFAIVGLEFAVTKVIPHLAKMFDIFDADKVAAAAEQLQKFREAAEKIEKRPSKEEKTTEQETQELFAGKNITGMAAGVIGTMGIGAQMTEEDKRKLAMSPGPAIRKEITDRLQQENVDMAAKAVAQAGTAGPESVQARSFLRSLAKQAPGAFPKNFETQLAGVEPEARKEWSELEEGLDNTVESAVAGSKRTKARKKEWDRAVNTQDAMIRQEEKEEEAEKKHQAAQRFAEEQRIEREQDRAERQAARENTPEARNRRAMSEQRNEIMGQAQALDRQNQAQGGRAATPQFLEQVTHQAVSNVNSGQDVAAAIMNAVRQTEQKIMQDVVAGCSGIRLMARCEASNAPERRVG